MCLFGKCTCNWKKEDYHPTPAMKALNIFLLFLIVVGVALLFTQDLWVPKVVDLLLQTPNERSISEPAPVPKVKPIAVVSYSCKDSKTIDAEYYKGTPPPVVPGQPPIPGGSIHLKLSDGRAMTLPQTTSADGSRYANKDESFIFWDKGDNALVLENNEQKSFVECVLKK